MEYAGYYKSEGNKIKKYIFGEGACEESYLVLEVSPLPVIPTCFKWESSFLKNGWGCPKSPILVFNLSRDYVSNCE
jgi:hypothetical protein